MNVYVAGCPPRPEALLDALLKLQKQVEQEPVVSGLTISTQFQPKKSGVPTLA